MSILGPNMMRQYLIGPPSPTRPAITMSITINIRVWIMRSDISNQHFGNMEQTSWNIITPRKSSWRQVTFLCQELWSFTMSLFLGHKVWYSGHEKICSRGHWQWLWHDSGQVWCLHLWHVHPVHHHHHDNCGLWSHLSIHNQRSNVLHLLFTHWHSPASGLHDSGLITSNVLIKN